MSDYKVKIDQQALKEFYINYPSEPTSTQLKAIKQVISVVLIKHYAAYLTTSKEELEAEALLAVCKNAQGFDPSYSAYNYCYTTIRNAIENYTKKYGREVIVEDYTPFNARADEETTFCLPNYVHKFGDYLTGKKKFELLEISPREMVNLRFFFLCNQKTRELQVPDHIRKHPRALEFLYRILMEK